MVSLAQLAGNLVNRERKCFSSVIRPDLAVLAGQIAQPAGRMTVVPDAAERLSPQAADLVRRIARGILDEPAGLMDQVHTAVSAAADEPLRSEPTLAAEVAASTRANVLHWAASLERDPGGPVPANLSPEVLGIAREAFRRAIEKTVYTTYHAGQRRAGVLDAHRVRAVAGPGGAASGGWAPNPAAPPMRPTQ